jgi:hypothetical protein
MPVHGLHWRPERNIYDVDTCVCACAVAQSSAYAQRRAAGILCIHRIMFLTLNMVNITMYSRRCRPTPSGARFNGCSIRQGHITNENRRTTYKNLKRHIHEIAAAIQYYIKILLHLLAELCHEPFA